MDYRPGGGESASDRLRLAGIEPTDQIGPLEPGQYSLRLARFDADAWRIVSDDDTIEFIVP